MPLVKKIENKTVKECLKLVQEAHDYLARCGDETVKRINNPPDLHYWGSNVKRTRIVLDGNNTPKLIDSMIPDYNITEIYNLCANLERLIDAMTWVQQNQDLNGYEVKICHPMGVTQHNDLELSTQANPNAIKARFEVSDVVGSNDGNDKEERELTRLGIFNPNWPDAQLFLVVSEDFAPRLRLTDKARNQTSNPCCHYHEVKTEGATRIFEVAKGKCNQNCQSVHQ